MRERNQEPILSDPLDDMFTPGLEDLMDEDFAELMSVPRQKQCLAEKRRRTEQRLEERRLRDELGYYDLDLDDF